MDTGDGTRSPGLGGRFRLDVRKTSNTRNNEVLGQVV